VKQLFYILLFTLAGNLALAQSALEITVLDADNSPAPGVNVELTNTAIGLSKGAVTNDQGKVRFNGLSTAGAYTVKVPDNGQGGSAELDDIHLISDKTTSATLSLQAAVEIGDVVITDGELNINSVDAQVASELSRKEIEELPIEGRDITRALYRLPNISQATGFFPEAPNVSINGANSLYTNYQIDGLDNNENFLGGQRFAMPQGFTQNITALTNNFSAEHGLTSNGVINITTRSGTNEHSGEAYYMTRPGPVIDASSAYAQRDLSGNQVKDGFMRQQFGFGVGGPLIKDKTFWFLNAEHTTDLKDNLLNVPQLGINTTVRGTNNFTYLSGKIDQNWSSKFRSSLRVNSGIVNVERQGGGLEGGIAFPSSGNKQDRNSLNLALKNTYATESFTYEGNYQFARFNWDYAHPNNPTSPDVTVFDSTGQAMAYLGHPGYAFKDIENTHVLQQKVTLQKGRHTFKAGGQIRSSGFELYGGANPNGSYGVMLSGAQQQALAASNPGVDLMPNDIPDSAAVLYYGIELRPTSFKARQNIYSIYAEDQISVSGKLNVNVGLRYDYDNLSKGGGAKGDFNNIAPRLSANYKISDRTSVRAGYGIYYDKILYGVLSDANQFNSTSADYKKQLQSLIDKGILPSTTNLEQVTNEGNLYAAASNVTYLNGPTAESLQGDREKIFQGELRIKNPNGYQNPYSHQIMAGVQHRVSNKFLVYLDLMHNSSYNLFRLTDLNAPAAYTIDPDSVVVRSQSDADLSRPVPIMTDGSGSYAVVSGDTLRGIARTVTMTETAGRSSYWAANLTLQKERGDDPYSFRLMYTLSLLRNNTEDINFKAMDANNFANEWGPSINDRRHIINGIFSYYPIKNLTLTMAALLQSGQPINRVPDASIYGTTDLNGDGRSFGASYVGNSDRQPGEARNSDRLPWSNTFDLSAFYKIPFGKKQSIEIGAYVFNLFNAVNLSGYSNNATQSNQIQVGPTDSGLLVRKNAAPPRQFQFSLRYQF
jgi:outer membrane receptor protein involved in Fe transport